MLNVDVQVQSQSLYQSFSQKWSQKHHFRALDTYLSNDDIKKVLKEDAKDKTSERRSVNKKRIIDNTSKFRFRYDFHVPRAG